MTIYKDIVSGDCVVLSDYFPIKKVAEGMLLLVEGKWSSRISHGVYCTCAEINEESTSNKDPNYKPNFTRKFDYCQRIRAVDVVETFNLVALPSYSKEKLEKLITLYCLTILFYLDDEKKKSEFKEGYPKAIEYLANVEQLQLYTGSSMRRNLIFTSCKEFKSKPIFLYFSHALEDASMSQIEVPFQVPRIPLLPDSIPHYKDRLSGIEILSDSFERIELSNGVLWEVAAMCDIINGEPLSKRQRTEGVDANDLKAIRLVDAFGLREQTPVRDPSRLQEYIYKYMVTLVPILKESERHVFLKGIKESTTYLISKLPSLHVFTQRSRWCSFVFAYKKENESEFTFVYFAQGLKRV